MININNSHDVLYHYLFIMIIMKPRGDERAVSLNLSMIILIINLKRVES
jgi:hypothetical protein